MNTTLIDLASNIGTLRIELVEAKIELRTAKQQLEDAENARRAGCDYNGLGKNAQAREIAFAEILRDDADYQALRFGLEASQNFHDRKQAILEQALDLRRAYEHTTYARLAEANLGKVDHIASEEGMAIAETRRELVNRQAERMPVPEFDDYVPEEEPWHANAA